MKINLKAVKAYGDYTDGDCIVHGVMQFETLEEAKVDAEVNIERFTRSDFPMAWFYEAVKTHVLYRMAQRRDEG